MITISNLVPEHWDDVQRIHREGIATGMATFETDAEPDWSHWAASHLDFARLVALEGDRVVGWAALTGVSGRCVYAGVAEVSIYVGADRRGRGIGSLLMARLIEDSEANGIWTLEAGILSENLGSIRLHERFGFRIVGRRERLGKLHGEWKDVMLLERRSSRVGLD